MNEKGRTTLDVTMGAIRDRDLAIVKQIAEVYQSEAHSLDPHHFGLLAVYHFGKRKGAKL